MQYFPVCKELMYIYSYSEYCKLGNFQENFIFAKADDSDEISSLSSAAVMICALRVIIETIHNYKYFGLEIRRKNLNNTLLV